MKITNETNILIIGLGLIGGSYAIGLTKRGYKVSAVDIDRETIDYALEKKYIIDGDTKIEDRLIKSADLIIFGLYPDQIKPQIIKYQDKIKKGALITDVSGVKASFVSEVQDILRDDLEYVSAHPMAGLERTGIKNSDDAIFMGANFIITPTEKNTSQGIDLVEELARILGFSRIVKTTTSNHDELIGFVSQLTHCIAISLMNCNHDEKLEDFTGDSFRDLTRIARIDEKLWSTLFMLNKDSLLHQMKLFNIAFSNLERLIMEGDKKGIESMMIKSSNRRKLFNKGNMEEE